MKKILVPTDFSINAEKALEYALHLAVYFSSELVLLHSWELPHQKSAMFASVQDMIRDKAEKDIRELKDKILSRYPELKVKTVVIMGDPADAIKSAAKNSGADYIIMGTKGASGLKKYFFGSITADVIEDAPCPVFAVPEKAAYRNIKTIAYATDFNADDFFAFDALMEIAQLFNAKIIITHISKAGKNEEQQFRLFVKKFEEQFNYNNLDTAFISGHDIVESLNKFVKEKNVDILALARRKRAFFEDIFHKSVTKEIAYSAYIPIIVFQSSD